MSKDEGRRKGDPPAEVEALRAELVRIKEEKQLSLSALAHDSEISRSTWNRVLKGESFPPRKAIERLSRRTRLEAEHLLGLWEAADAALKRAAANAASPAAADGDHAASPPAAPVADPGSQDSSTASEAGLTPSLPDGDALGAAATASGPTESTPTAPLSEQSSAPTAAATTHPPAPDPAAPAKARPAQPAAAASSQQDRDAPVTGGKRPPGDEQIAAHPAAAPARQEIGVVHPVTAPASTAKTSRAAKLLVTFLALTVVLLIGRWAAMPDHDANDTAAPQTTGETLPDTTDDTGESTGTGNDGSPQNTAQPSSVPPAAGSDERPQDLPAAGPGDSRATAPRASSDANTTAPSDGQEPQEENRPAAQAPTTTAPTTTASSLGEEGRTACAHYKPNRRVILAKGMVGTNVAQVQCLLNHNYDYNLKEDGVFGPETEAGVKAIQRCSGITADGKVGPETWKYLDYPKPACGH
ncbi:peptidoglycan-binding protein [Streptomyces sp. NPDC127063]|uniref:peptidoglycan-binding protein n=1 Tax=Streptomyces sp. NPDC127063 TaxID=3347123 RepID=UPI0036618713